MLDEEIAERGHEGIVTQIGFPERSDTLRAPSLMTIPAVVSCVVAVLALFIGSCRDRALSSGARMASAGNGLA